MAAGNPEGRWMAAGLRCGAVRICARSKPAPAAPRMATYLEARPAVTVAAVVALLSAAFVLFGPPLNSGTRPRGGRRTGAPHALRSCTSRAGRASLRRADARQVPG